MARTPKPDGRRPVVRTLTLLCGLAVVAAGCGHRMAEEEILARNAVTASGGTLAPGQSAGATSGVSGDATTTGDGSTADTIVTTGTGGAGTSTGGSTGATTGTGGSGAGGASTSGTGQAAAATKAPIKVGFIGALSGAAGVTVGSARDGWVIWAKWINARGGINGHPIEVLVGDDGTNDARGVALARDFVENKGAVALSWASNDLGGLADYAKRKRVPIIGVVEGQDVWASNPMLFPVSSGAAGSWGTVRAAKVVGATKLAVFYCVEAATCEKGATSMNQFLDEEGVSVVYRAGVSLTQPDFTAECIQARNRGANGMVLLMDQNAVSRFVQSCHRQGYKPVPIGPSSDALAKLPEMEGLAFGSATFPWFLRGGSQGIEEYAEALRRYAPNLMTDGSAFQSLSWTGAKVFQKAIENATRTKNPDKLTSADVLEGLWAMKGETADGVLQGGLARTYNREAPQGKWYCTFVAQLKGGKWGPIGGNGATPTCRG